METDKSTGGLDYFKMFAAFLVIAIHTSPLSSVDGNADFVLTRILARIAVPFFLMVTGYFLLPQYLFQHAKNASPLKKFLQKTFFLYVIAILLYLPVNLYAKHFSGATLSDLLRFLLFEGTFYHLWYLPAAMLGALLVVLMCRKLPFPAVFCTTVVLYLLGLLGDSYFGLLPDGGTLQTAYKAMFQLFSYTRNGIFYAPVFLAMGAGISQINKPHSKAVYATGFTVSAALLILEGCTLHHFRIQRHDSMYIALLPCMFFLFQLILSVKARPVKAFRTVSTWIYIIHPLVIILVRGAAKITHLAHIFSENSLVHYCTVCLLSCTIAVIIQKISLNIGKQPLNTDRAWIELNMQHLRQNVAALQSLLPPGCVLMPAVKANAYGHGAVWIAKELNQIGIRSFCVATVTEGIELRKNNIKGDILILGYTHPQQFSDLRKYNLTQTVIDLSYAQLLHSYGKKIKVHLKIDTGMHRLGERFENEDALCSMMQCKNLIINGAYTHLCADETKTKADTDFTKAQVSAFYHAVADLKKHGFCGKVHILASYGLLHYPQFGGNYARIGIALYGVLSNRADLASCPVQLQPVLSVKARIALTKDLHAGEAVGYGLSFTADSDRKIAVLSIGYADGIPRSLSCGMGSVLISGKEAPIIGRICMDQMIADITNVPEAQSGDIATIIGKSGQYEMTAYDLAEADGTITNEILSRLGERLKRIVIES